MERDPRAQCERGLQRHSIQHDREIATRKGEPDHVIGIRRTLPAESLLDGLPVSGCALAHRTAGKDGQETSCQQNTPKKTCSDNHLLSVQFVSRSGPSLANAMRLPRLTTRGIPLKQTQGA